MSNVDTYTKIQAAMFAALGSITKFSRSGNSVVFAEPVMGRNDLSGDDDRALCQARAAGLDPDAVADEQVQAWLDWHGEMHEARRIGPEARFLITRKFSMQVGAHTLVPGNRVSLIDGWGQIIHSAEIECLSKYDPEGTDQLGRKGAISFSPDYPRINRWIEKMRKQFPEFTATRVLDNNVEKKNG